MVDGLTQRSPEQCLTPSSLLQNQYVAIGELFDTEDKDSDVNTEVNIKEDTS